MIFSVFLNYCFGRMVEKFGKKRWLLVLCVALNLLILGYFKYYNFLAEVLNPLLCGFGIALPAIQVTLPIGISFYTFQALSYVVDVYRGENRAQKNPLNMMLYISFFPQLIAGPNVKYHDIEEQIENRTVTLEGFSYGVKRFIFGLGKKVILANTFAEVVDAVYAYQAADVSRAMLWLTALLYMLQIYFDFPATRTWRLDLEKCLDLHSLKTSACRTRRPRFRISGGNGIFPFPAGLKSTCIYRLVETGEARRGRISTFGRSFC